MTFRGVYRDGVIVPDELLRLNEGARVDFSIRKVSAAEKRPVGRARKPSRSKAVEQRVAAFMQGFGVRKNDRTDKGKSSAVIARELRSRAMGDRFRG